ncbi:hydrogenase nickel incorporation protein HypB [Thiomicrospira microaerophila]|uniref:hydrogenase nickel incorporation protein HypB n=1 Tax=Thiomicrospira microaerophila TaxID=406020 RepID=UPI00200FCB9B|nr:hydrogenase nickel incorporation protein HypB [Thiomicrospira microaerophila]UQB42505.1 hydrogenase nickel incorporation protein HypB [Thiomicrospira microaerophila]
MCEDCGCSLAPAKPAKPLVLDNVKLNPQLNDSKTLNVIHQILDKNNQQAEHNRAHFDRAGVLALNMMSSPGSGKTRLLEALADLPEREFRFGVIEGDLETNRDADRIQAKGIVAHQIQTGTACHLDAFMVHKGLHAMPLDQLDVCFIENVGNLVCPASYDVGSHLNIVLLSVPEGDDKVDKYPVMFQKADLVLITKCDLLPHFEFDLDAVKAAARRLKPNVDILSISALDSTSVERVADWIRFKRKMRD